jgi:hypothetical protein
LRSGRQFCGADVRGLYSLAAADERLEWRIAEFACGIALAILLPQSAAWG